MKAIINSTRDNAWHFSKITYYKTYYGLDTDGHFIGMIGASVYQKTQIFLVP